MVMGAFSIEVAAVVVDTAVVQRAETHESMLQGVVPFLVHVVVPDYILLTGKPLQKGRGEKNAQQVYLNQSQNEQQVTLSLWKQQLQHLGANWQMGRAPHTAIERARMSLNMTCSVVIDLLCISPSCVLSKCHTNGSGTFSIKWEAWNKQCAPHTPPVFTFFFFFHQNLFFF